MKNLLLFLLGTTIMCFAGTMNVNFNDGTPTAEIAFSSIDNIKILTPPDGFVFVLGGTFQMGDEDGDLWEQCRPVHQVTLNSFYMGKCEITQSEWATYMPSPTYDHGSGSDYPVYHANWYAIIKYCNLRSMTEGLTPCYTINSSTDPADWGSVPTSSNSTWDAAICNWSANGYRLPTEAEWEYAARGGIYETDGYLYSGSNIIGDVAWYYINSSNISHPVGTKAPNQLGIYDMSGNLWEYCWDWWNLYTIDAQINPTGPTVPDAGFELRLGRGGYWGNTYGDNGYRVAGRRGDYPGANGEYHIGFRISRTP